MGFHKGMSGLAVCMFFFVSGLLIAKSCATQPWRRFWAARILRIYPALWVNLIFCVLVGAMVSTLGASEFLLHPDIRKFMLYDGTLLHAYFVLPNVFTHLPWNGINGSLWTLSEELRMYIACFAIGLVGILRNKLLFNMLCLAISLCYLALGELPNIYGATKIHLLLYFMLGMACYVNAAHIRLQWVMLAGLMLALIPIYIWLPRTCYDLGFAVALGYFVLLLAYKKHVNRLDFSNVGDFSYGVYLYGYPIQQLIIWWHDCVINPLWLFALTMAAIAPIAGASWFAVERPALRLLKKVK